MEEAFRFETVGPERLGEFMAFYRSLIGEPGCTWDETYPDPEQTRLDLENREVRCLLDADGRIAGAVTLSGMEEDILSVPGAEPYADCLLPVRLGVRRDLWGRGLGARLFTGALDWARERGGSGLLFLVSRENPRAKALYERLGSRVIGPCRMYDEDFYLMVREL